jgi:4-hydroxy-tetrahydrodipicolinate synthase
LSSDPDLDEDPSREPTEAAHSRRLLVALLTPFDARGRVDLARLRAHVLWLAAHGVDGFLPTLAAGEFLYLSDREREAIHRTVLDAARGREVIPGVWDALPANVSFLTDGAKSHGASGVALAPPLGYDLDDRILRQWYETAAQRGSPVWVYNDPRLQAAHLSPALYRELRRTKVVAGLIDVSDDWTRAARLARLDPAAVYAASDRLLVKAPQLVGSRGVVSMIANAWPSFCRRLFRSSEVQLEDALTDRLQRLRAAGGLRALKALLRMPCRAPLLEPTAAELVGLPPAETA